MIIDRCENQYSPYERARRRLHGTTWAMITISVGAAKWGRQPATLGCGAMLEVHRDELDMLNVASYVDSVFQDANQSRNGPS